MMRMRVGLVGLALAAAVTTLSAQNLPWLQWTLLSRPVMSEIIGESSGENAWKMIMETGGYDKDRTAEEFDGLFYETAFFMERGKAYGLPNLELVKYPGGTAWDGIKGELWEVSPVRQKLASYTDLAAMLAEGSATGEATGELIWVGAGQPADFTGKDVTGKIVVTEGSVSAVHRLACIDRGALGVVGVLNSTRPLFDPLQMTWGRVSGSSDGSKPARFAFQMPPREGEYLKKRLLAGQKIAAHAAVVSATRKVQIQDITWAIPGTDPTAGEVIFSAHLFEGYVKQGGNDDISGCAVAMEIGRLLNVLINEGRIPRPKRTIRFIIGPEFSGTGPWVKANRALMAKTLCNINFDMVGLLLSKSQSFMCLMRTTFGNAHYVNDVVENYFRYIGDSSRERIHARSGLSPAPHRIVAPSGADEPFYYAIDSHFGSSDHEVFNDWGVQVPGVMLITWPDRWLHTSGDHVDKTDPTTLKRVAIIGAASAYTIASADDEMAVRIATETATNAAARLALQAVRGTEALNAVTSPEALPAAWAAARGFVEGTLIGEKDTLESVNELAADRKRVAGHVAALQKSTEQIGSAHLAALDAHMRAVAAALKTAPVSLVPSDLELRASKIVPRQTPKVTAAGYQGYREALTAVPQEQRAKFRVASGVDTAELQRLVNGRHSALDIKRLLDAQSQTATSIQDVLNHLEILALAGLIEK